MADIQKFIEEVKSMTVLELNDLVKALEEEFGVSAAAPVAVAGGAVAGGAAEEKRPAGRKKTHAGRVPQRNCLGIFSGCGCL